MARAARITLSAIGGVVYVLLVGALTTHADAQSSGAVLDLGGAVVSVREPAKPWLLWLAVAVVSAVVVAAGTGTRDRPSRVLRPGPFALTAGAVTVVMLATASVSFVGPIALEQALLPGWAQVGARSAAVHVVVVALVWAAWRQSRFGSRGTRTRTPAPAAETH